MNEKIEQKNEFTCIGCGGVFPRKKKDQKRCAACRIVANKERTKRNYKRRERIIGKCGNRNCSFQGRLCRVELRYQYKSADIDAVHTLELCLTCAATFQKENEK